MSKSHISYPQGKKLEKIGFRKKNSAKKVRKINTDIDSIYCVPTYQDIFTWFREKYGLYHHIIPEFYIDGINFLWQILWHLPYDKWGTLIISDGTMQHGDDGEYPIYEDAEFACIDKLIEIVEKQQRAQGQVSCKPKGK